MASSSTGIPSNVSKASKGPGPSRSSVGSGSSSGSASGSNNGDGNGTNLPSSSGKLKVEHDNIWEEIARIASLTLIPKLPCPPEDDYEEIIGTFYENNRAIAHTNLEAILKLFGTIGKSPVAMRKHVIPLFMLFGEQEDGLQPWSSPQNERLVFEIIRELYRIFDMDMNVRDIGPLTPFFQRDFDSMSPAKTTFAHLLKYFRSCLGDNQGDWKMYPAARASYFWLVCQVKYPYLSDHIEGSLIPALNFLEDFEAQHVTVGIRCISHILDNVIKASFKASGWGSLVLKQLRDSLLHQKEAGIIDRIVPELMKVLKIIEIDPSMYPEQYTLYDSTLEKLLDTFEMAEDSASKNVWLRHLTTYIDVMGHATVHWINRILRILLDNTSCADSLRWLNVLKCCKVCILNTWTKPQSAAFCEIILRILYNAVELNMTPNQQQTEGEAVTKIFEAGLECLGLLKYNSDYEELHPELQNFRYNGKGKLPLKVLQSWDSLLQLSYKK